MAFRMLEQWEGEIVRVREYSQSIRYVRNTLYIDFERDRTMGTMNSNLHVHVFEVFDHMYKINHMYVPVIDQA